MDKNLKIRKLKIGNLELENNIFLAPMAGYTNSSYRIINKQFGAGLVFSEMVSAKGIFYNNQQTLDYLHSTQIERPFAIQIFGSEVDDLIYATKYICKHNLCEIIDINMGCPVKKVIKQNAGSSLLADLDLIKKIVSSVVLHSSVPVSVKIRAGLTKNSINCSEVSKIIESANASMITIHGRTQKDMYSGTVNLDYIKMVKDSVSIPVIGNGDIKSIEDFNKMIEYTNCDGVMIGRASLGNPWIFKEIITNEKQKIELLERIELIKQHYSLLKESKGMKLALLQMRSLACFYLKSVKNSKEIKLQLINIGDEEHFLSILNKIK